MSNKLNITNSHFAWCDKVKLFWVNICALFLFIAITTALYIAAIKPLSDRNRETHNLQSRLSDDISQFAELKQEKYALSEELQGIHSKIANYPYEFELSSTFDEYLAMIAALIESSQLTVDYIEPSPEIISDNYSLRKIAVSGRGSYSSCALLMQTLHQHHPDSSVISFEVSGNPKANTDVWVFQMEIVWRALREISEA